MNETELRNIILGCINNERLAQEKLYKQYHALFYKFITNYISNKEDLLEVLNNGFLKIFKSIVQYDESKGKLTSWMYTIIQRSVVDFMRSKKQVFYTNDYEIGENAWQQNPDIDEKINLQDLMIHFNKIQPATKMVATLFWMEGHTHKEISQLLGISEGTSKWHVSEAKKKMQVFLQNS